MHNPSDSPTTVERLLIEAIALKRLVAATYNGNEMMLAPHQLFTRRGALFVSAFNTRRTWRSDDERRLGHFKLDGLSDVKLEPSSFDPLPTFDASLPHKDDEQVFSV
jgi:WYL domain